MSLAAPWFQHCFLDPETARRAPWMHPQPEAGQAGAALLQHALHRRREIQDEVKPIGDLLALRGANRCPFGIEAAAVTGDRCNLRMLLEPFGKALRRPIWQQVHHAVQVQVDHDCSVLLAFAPSPVIDTQVTNGQTILMYRFLLDAAEDGVVAGAHGQMLENSLPGTASGPRFQHSLPRGSVRPAKADARGE